MKQKAGERVGINVEHIKLPQTTTQASLLDRITALNEASDVHGVIVQVSSVHLKSMPP